MIYRISLVLEALLIIKCIHDLYGERLKLRTELIIFMACDLVLMECVYQGYLPGWCSSLIYVMLIAYCFAAFRPDIKRLLVNLILAIVMLSVLQMVCFFVVYGIVGSRLETVVVTLLTYILMYLCYWLFTAKMKLEKISKYFQRSYVIIKFCLVMVSVIVIACIVATKVYLEMFGLIYVIMAVAVVFATVMAVNWLKNKEKAIAAEAQLNAYTLYGKSYENLIMEIRARQHEFDNHLNAIYSLHRMHKDYESLVKHQREYCQDIQENQKYAKLLRLNNTAMSGFLYGKFVEAERCGIEVTYDIELSQVLAGVPEYKMVEIIGNLVNNAIEALKDSADKRMSVKMYREDGKGIILVENVGDYMEPTLFNAMFKKGYSSKGENRGLGLHSIKRMSEEYNFQIMCTNEEYEGVNWISFRIEKIYEKGAV